MVYVTCEQKQFDKWTAECVCIVGCENDKFISLIAGRQKVSVKY